MAFRRSKFGPSSDKTIFKMKMKIEKLKLDQKRMIEWAREAYYQLQEHWKTEKSLILDEFDKRMMQADHNIQLQKDEQKQEQQKPVPKISRKQARKARREAAEAEVRAGQAKDMKQNKTKAKKPDKRKNARKDDNFEK